jgi:SAM-dependent methyltransferase
VEPVANLSLEGEHNTRDGGQLPMVRCADGTGPGAFDEGQAAAYAAAMDIETEFPHDRVFLDILRRHARGAALDLGGGAGRYAAWLLHMGLATSVHVIDSSPLMIDACLSRGVPGLTAQVADIETADLGRAHYDTALARFVLMHARELAGTLNHIALSLKETGTLAIVTNVVEGAPTALRTFLEESSGIMKLMLQVKGQPIRVANYVRTREDYVKAVRQAGLRLAWCEAYEPKILRFEQERPGVLLSHLVLVGTK